MRERERERTQICFTACQSFCQIQLIRSDPKKNRVKNKEEEELMVVKRE
jgi:hypothetical protein